MATETLLWLIPLPPLLAFGLIILVTNRWKALSHSLAIGAAFLSWLVSMVVFIRAISTSGLSKNPFMASLNWLPTGDTWLRIGVQIDPLSAVTLFFVAWTVLAIFVYSVGYHNYGQPIGDHDRAGLPPQGATEKDRKGHRHSVPSVEPMYSRFFAFISLFAFAMYTLVVSDNLLTLYIGWEIMGLCSYLLIGFWYGKEKARDAAIKAFLTTRVGDVFMLLGLVGLYSATGTLNYQAIFQNEETLHMLASTGSGILGLSLAGLYGILLFIGTIGKSAQFPLHVWLPDAMEGPTPVSAMIHAATMVSAGVYLAIRIFPLVETSATALMVMSIIGAFTALFAATIAVAQNDIKKVLAYSTISQLGYMIAALGVGAYVAAAFHLLTHAFFKALLFLGSGSVIHGMEHGIFHTGSHVDPQDMLNMGGLRRKMPITFWTFLVGGLALSGFPLITAGFWSKDEVLSGAFNNGHTIVFWTLVAAALLTAFYTMRQITLTFLGQPRSKAAEHAQETPATMTAPLVVLSIFAVTAGWVGIPEAFPGLGGLVPNWFGNFVGSMLAEGEVAGHSLLPLIMSVIVSLGGLTLGWLTYRRMTAGQPDPIQRNVPGLHNVLKNKYYFDELYHKIFVIPSWWISETFSAKFVDEGIIDGTLHAIGRLGLWLGSFFRNGFDLPVINHFFEWITGRVPVIGGEMRKAQTGRVQQYMVMAILIVVVVGALFYYFLV